jgi:putative membrane protein
MLLNNKISIRFYVRPILRQAFLVFLFANLVVISKWVSPWSFQIPISMAAILGTCIALLLAFRTNQAYDRWWEARIAWGAIVNDSRSFIRQLQTFLPANTKPQPMLHGFVERQCAWCYVLGDTLRGQPVLQRLEEFLPTQEARQIADSHHSPNLLLVNQALALRRLFDEELITDYQLVQLSATLSSLTDSMGRCERIKHTVFPRTYTFNMQVFIYLFASILPFCFDDEYFYLDVPLVTLISSAFILIEKSAIQLQDPFENKPTDTPVTTIARSIEISLKSMTGYTPIPAPLVPERYYLL